MTTVRHFGIDRSTACGRAGKFVADNEGTVNYEARHYDTRVVTKAEREIRLPTVERVERVGEEPLRPSATHEPL